MFLSLGVKISQVVVAKPVQVVNVHRLFLRFLVPNCAKQVHKRKEYAEVQMSKLNSDLVHANIYGKANSWQDLNIH
jgi:hypothetical protein